MSEDQLIQGLLRRDRDTLKYVFDTYKDLILQIAFKYLKSYEDSEEVMQEVFLRAFRRIDQFNRRAKFKTWLIRIAINSSINFLKSVNNYRATIKGDANIMEQSTWVTDTEDPEQLLFRKEGKNTLRKAIAHLTDRQRIAFTLHYLEGIKQLDVAEIMDESLDAVESLINRAKIKLKCILKSHKQAIYYE